MKKVFTEPEYAHRYEPFYPMEIIETNLPEKLRCFHCGAWFTREEQCQQCGVYVCPYCHGCLCQDPLPRNVLVAVQDTWVRTISRARAQKRKDITNVILGFTKEYRDARWVKCTRYGEDLRTCGRWELKDGEWIWVDGGYRKSMDDDEYPTCLRDGRKCDARWIENEEELIACCPLCGKEYRGLPSIPLAKRLRGHLTGKHCKKGEELQRLMSIALYGGT